MEAQETKPQVMPTQSEQLNELFAALAKAQGAMKGASRDAENPHFRSKYADLASVWEACRKPLADNGLSVVQRAASGQGYVRVVTILGHASGQWISDALTVPVSKGDAHGVLAALTYARRGSLSAMVGVAPEDDDGNAASGVSHESSVKAYVGSAAKAQKPEQRAAKASSGAVVPFGPHKGELIPKQSDETLKMLVDAMGKSIADPDKARFKESNQALLDAVNSEVLRRKEDIPF